MAYDFKKEYKDLYIPKQKPMLIDAPAMTFAAVAGSGDPNEEDGAYKQALGLLYAFSYTVKMSKMGDWQPDGYFDYVVPPLEGFWWGKDGAFDGTGITDKSELSWVSLIRQPDFVTKEVFDQVCALVSEKKPELAPMVERGDLSLVHFTEGRCVQIMHKGPYDNEPATIEKIAEYMDNQGLRLDIGNVEDMSPKEVLGLLDCDGAVPDIRFHHEIYLGDPRRTKPENLKTVIRHPVM